MKKWKKCLGAGLLLGTLFVFTGCGADTVVKVGREKLELPELMYYVYEAEKDGKVYEDMYQDFFSESYWDSEYKDGKTFRETAKEDAYENSIMYTIFEERAKEAGYTLSEEETAECEKEATEEYAGLSETQREAIGLEREEFIALKKKIMLGNKYYDVLLDGLDVNEEKAASGILEEDYIQHDVEYLYAAEEVLLKPYLKRAQDGEDFAVMAEELPEELEAGYFGFREGDYSLGETFEKEALALENGEATDRIIAEEDGYYIIRMVDNASLAGYEAACEEAVLNAQSEAFKAAYETIKKEYKIKKYASDWDSLIIGELTTGRTE